jgi:hypothetical protein
MVLLRRRKITYSSKRLQIRLITGGICYISNRLPREAVLQGGWIISKRNFERIAFTSPLLGTKKLKAR